MKVEQIYVGNLLKNFVYILHDEKNRKAWVIDPYDAKQVEKFLDSNNYDLEMVINTHLHFDHTKGNKKLLKRYQAKLWDIEKPADIALVEGYQLKVRKAPGHTKEHVVFTLVKEEKQIGFFGGDTIFHNGVGNCKNGGNLEKLFETLEDLKSWVDPDALFYTGHDYGISNIKFSMAHSSLDLLQNELERFENSSTRIFPFDRELKTNIFLSANRDNFFDLRNKRDRW